MSYVSVAFHPHLDTRAFESGEPSLDDWLRHAADTETRRGSARVWVWLDQQQRVVAYYSLSASKLTRDAIPHKLGRGGPREIPAVLIGRLALDHSLHGERLGEVLLADALDRIVDATRTVGARFVVVDALHEKAATFYERLGFQRIPSSLLLVQKIADIVVSREQI